MQTSLKVMSGGGGDHHPPTPQPRRPPITLVDSEPPLVQPLTATPIGFVRLSVRGRMNPSGHSPLPRGLMLQPSAPFSDRGLPGTRPARGHATIRKSALTSEGGGL